MKNDKDGVTTVNNSEGKRVWWNRTVMGFSLASLFSDMGHELVTSLTPGFLLMLGAPPIALGLIEGVSGVGQSIAGLWGGRKADESRNRMALIGAGYLATILKAFYGIVGFWPWLVVLRTVGWIGRGMRGPLRDTLIAESVPPEAYGRALGVRESLDTFGAIAGPFIGAILLSRLGYRSLFLCTAAPGLLAFLSVSALVRDTKRPQAVGSIDPTGAGNSMPADPSFRYPTGFKRLLVADTFFSVGNVAPSFFILVSLHDLRPLFGGVAASLLSVIFYSWYNLVYALTTLIAGSLTDRIGPRPVLLSGFVSCFFSLLGFAFLPGNIAVVAVLFTLAGVAVGTLESSQKTYVRLVLPKEIRGRGLGLHASWMGFGALASGVLIGGLWTIGAPSWGFAAAALAVFIGLLLLLTTVPSMRAGTDRD